MESTKRKKTIGEKPRKINKWLFWSPRIISIIFILFLAMFSLDIFGNGYGFWETIIGLLMHNIPVFILTVFLIVAWRLEWVGAVGFFLSGVLYIIIMIINSARTFEWYMLSYSLIIAGPAILIGILWLLNWKKRKTQ